MIQVCCYKGCGIVYGEKEPLSDKAVTHGYCPEHFAMTLKEIEVELGKVMAKSKKFKVLIVEDSTFYRESLILTLRERYGSIEIDGAGDGEGALQKVETLHPNLIFMDIRLPGGSGLELTRKIKTSSPETIIIILTSYDLPEYREAANRYRADYFFPKGSTAIEDIFRLVESVLPTRA